MSVVDIGIIVFFVMVYLAFLFCDNIRTFIGAILVPLVSATILYFVTETFSLSFLVRLILIILCSMSLVVDLRKLYYRTDAKRDGYFKTNSTLNYFLSSIAWIFILAMPYLGTK